MQQTNSSSLWREHRAEIVIGIVVTALVLLILVAGWFS